VGKGARNRTIRREAHATAIVTPGVSAKSIARAQRRHGRMPLAQAKSKIQVARPGDILESLRRKK
jgi:hypothetical protein